MIWAYLSNFWLKCSGISVQALLDGFLSLFLVVQVVHAVVAIAVVTELSVGETFTISVKIDNKIYISNIIFLAIKCRKFRKIGITYSFRQCDFVQLHGFLCLTPDDSYFSSGGSCLMLGLTSSGSSSGGNISSSRLARLAPPLKLFCFGVTTRLIAWFYIAG